MKPDSNHLHQLIFYFIKTKFKNKNILHVNLISSVLINIYNFFDICNFNKFYFKFPSSNNVNNIKHILLFYYLFKIVCIKV